ncbi:MAG: class I SAM-dependent methyltransferase [Marinilabiliales bacterium]|nr:class I SAM-dependent methyltransferase [Marinilabiliales bacterium]
MGRPLPRAGTAPARPVPGGPGCSSRAAATAAGSSSCSSGECEVTAVDREPAMCRRVEQAVGGRGVPVLCGELADLPRLLPDRRFDTVLALGVVTGGALLPGADRAATFAALAGALADAGVLLLDFLDAGAGAAGASGKSSTNWPTARAARLLLLGDAGRAAPRAGRRRLPGPLRGSRPRGRRAAHGGRGAPAAAHPPDRGRVAGEGLLLEPARQLRRDPFQPFQQRAALRGVEQFGGPGQRVAVEREAQPVQARDAVPGSPPRRRPGCRSAARIAPRCPP